MCEKIEVLIKNCSKTILRVKFNTLGAVWCVINCLRHRKSPPILIHFGLLMEKEKVDYKRSNCQITELNKDTGQLIRIVGYRYKRDSLNDSDFTTVYVRISI